jgi:serine protease
VSVGFPRRAQVCVAAGAAVTCLILSSAPAFAGSVRGQEWWLRKLHVTNAWQSTRAGGVTVAVLDTGVDPAQADLIGAVTTGPDYTNSGRLPGGQFWGVHGTAMASLIAGRGHGAGQAAGLMGVAPGATILSVRVTLESSDPLLADANIAAALPGAIAHGIRYAVNHGAGVIDLPLDPVTTPGAPGAGGSPAERAAVDYALAHRVVLVAPAGDDGAGADQVNFPAAYPGVISVGAFNSSFTKAAFSSQQPYVMLTAPGDGVLAATPPTGYVTVSSTSAASAVVAGIVALIRAQFPALRPAQVARALKQSTVYRPSGGPDSGSGAGTVDANRALMAAARMIETVPTSGPSAANGTPAAQAPAPAPPAVVHKKGNLRGTLLLDGGIALAVFLVLAVPILTYSYFRRRRARAARLAEVRAAAQVPARRVKQAASAAAQEGYVPAPLSPGLSATTSSPGVTAATGAGSPMHGGNAAFPGSAFPGAGQRPGPAETGGELAGGVGSPPVPGAAAARAIGSHRMGLARPPRISGSPPWEPAPEPTGEVPWGRTPAAAGGGLVPTGGQGAGTGPAAGPAGFPAVPELPSREAAVPEISPWDAVAQEAWPGGPSAPRPPAPPPGMAATNGSGGKKQDSNWTGEEDPSDPSRPIYVWNPGASTEAFPTIPPDEQDKR